MKNIKPIVIYTAAALCVITSPVQAAKHAARTPQATAWHDPRVDVGIVKTATTLFAEPSTISGRISPLAPHDWTVLVSRQATDGWYHVIQFTTGRQGWVLGSRLIIRYTHNPAPGVDLQSAVTGTQDPPTIDVNNDSGKNLFLHVQGMPEIVIEPHGTQHVTLVPGFSTYNAAYPGLIPLFGEKAFVNGSAYTWRFYVTTGMAAKRTHAPIDLGVKTEVHQLQQDVNNLTVELKVSKQVLDADETAFDSQAKKLNADQDAMEAQRKTLDHSNQAAVDTFNQTVDATNAELAEAQTAKAKYDAEVVAYNTKLDELNKKQKRLDELTEGINSRE